MKRIRNIYIRNLLTIALILLLSFASFGAVFATLSHRFVLEEKRASMSVTANELGQIVSSYARQWPLESLEVRVALASTGQISGFHIVACTPEGSVVSCSDREIRCEHLETYIPEDFRRRTDADGPYSGVSNLGGVYGEDRYVLGIPVTGTDGEEAVCYLFLSEQVDGMVAMWRKFFSMFALVACGVMIAAFGISLVATKKQTRPIRQIAHAAHRFARGDFSVRVPDTRRRDEIGELESAFNGMAESLERAEKQRREFVANVSHELKTPMTTISGFADGILDGTIPPERAQEYLRVISSETKRLSRLVRGMLDMSRVQSMDAQATQRSSFDVSEAIRVALLSLEDKITTRGLDVDVQLPEEAVLAIGDRDAILQVVYNLIDNAAKFAAGNTTIVLELWRENGRIFTAVENRGETIPREELPMIFDRFHKTDKSRSMDRDGVGLGLYIVKTILDRHNQDIFVTSENGVTRFVFTLLPKIEK